jgi:spore coat protein CotH
MEKRMVRKVLFFVLIAAILAGCASAEMTQATLVPDVGDPKAEVSQNAADAAHSSDSAPDYAVVFPQDSVNRIDITLSAQAWADLQAEMAEQFGAQGAGEWPGQGQDKRQPPQNQQPSDRPEGQAPGDLQPGMRPGGVNVGGMDFGEISYVSSTVTFDGDTWENVGFRYSGNSTLQTSWRSATNKISFRLDFDEFEDEVPSITDQRFYGFKQISFKSNAMDDSYLREKVVADIFREAGVVSSQTAFYEVYVDYGEGSQYFGLYTAVEIVDDTVIETQFADDSGNVYKPDGAGATFAEGAFSEESFEKQTNQEEADWSDIQAVFEALHSELRASDPAAWRAGLEAVFDVDAFIRWLAVDTIIQNWDTYGASPHNYYLYTDPEDGLVTWIPWDNNMALSESMGPGGGNREGPAGGDRVGPNRSVRELDLSSVGEQWPLIRFLMDDPIYRAKYQAYLGETIQGAFQLEKLEAAYREYHALITPSVEKETQGYTQLDSFEDFERALDGLIQHAKDRVQAVAEYLR